MRRLFPGSRRYRELASRFPPLRPTRLVFSPPLPLFFALSDKSNVVLSNRDGPPSQRIAPDRSLTRVCHLSLLFPSSLASTDHRLCLAGVLPAAYLSATSRRATKTDRKGTTMSSPPWLADWCVTSTSRVLRTRARGEKKKTKNVPPSECLLSHLFISAGEEKRRGHPGGTVRAYIVIMIIPSRHNSLSHTRTSVPHLTRALSDDYCSSSSPSVLSSFLFLMGFFPLCMLFPPRFFFSTTLILLFSSPPPPPSRHVTGWPGARGDQPAKCPAAQG